MELREQFEKLHPVPEGVVFDGDTYYAPDSWRWPLAVKQQAIWQGFQSGRLFGLDEAREFTSKHEYAGEIAIEIDTTKEPK